MEIRARDEAAHEGGDKDPFVAPAPEPVGEDERPDGEHHLDDPCHSYVSKKAGNRQLPVHGYPRRKVQSLLVGADSCRSHEQGGDQREGADGDHAPPERPVAAAHEQRGRHEERELRLEDQRAQGHARPEGPSAAKQGI